MYSEPDNSETNECVESETPCMMHRYHVVHICGCGTLHSHSQGDCNDHRLHPIGISIPARFCNHGETAHDLFDKLTVYGLLPYGTKGYENVYSYFAEHEEARRGV
jgi:hypothetical protein